MLHLLFHRGGLNLMEEKATRKMSSHSFTNLSAAQVGALPANVPLQILIGGDLCVINRLFCS